MFIFYHEQPLQPVHNTVRPSPPNQSVPFPASKPPISFRRKQPHARAQSSVRVERLFLTFPTASMVYITDRGSGPRLDEGSRQERERLFS